MTSMANVTRHAHMLVWRHTEVMTPVNTGIRGDTITRIVVEYMCTPNIVVVNMMHICPVTAVYHLLNK